ncbi:glycosyltransferase family A protein [Ancylobacter sp. TS-1]|uniref:glycosyltransferase family 2 protein n=1 Tax=Ancylobacter sp. TS-1 TaxID=1850374 RepID=UPI001265C408|nr:glycosyltransferase family A protein [Ancylobacter sp. TS-1]QFR32048.1 glycosyltransferase [Ancylobacter sp. TS-1]
MPDPSAPRFSVLLPTHNRADVVGVAIRSVLAQSEPDFELLVVGDGCTDATAQVVAAFDDPRIRWFDLPKAPGFGYANRNVGLRQARGELIGFMAHDDIVLPDHLERMGRFFDDAHIDLAYSRPLWVTTDGIVVATATNLRNREDAAAFRRHNFAPASCIVHRRSCLERAGYWPEDVPTQGDWHLWKRIVREDAGNVAYEPCPTALHFVADWKRDRASLMPQVARMLAIVDTTDWWPASLRVDVSQAANEQAAFARLMETDPGWTGRMREDVVLVLDRLARSVLDGTMVDPRRRRRTLRALRRLWARLSP